MKEFKDNEMFKNVLITHQKASFFANNGHIYVGGSNQESVYINNFLPLPILNEEPPDPPASYVDPTIYYSMDDRDLSGNILLDRSGNLYNATGSNLTTSIVGQSRQAFSFNGTTSNLSASNYLNVNAGTAFTVSLWANLNGNATNYSRLIGNRTNAASGAIKGWYIKLGRNTSTDRIPVAILDSGNGPWMEAIMRYSGVNPIGVPTTGWFHLAFVYYISAGSAYVKTFYNGVSQTSPPFSNTLLDTQNFNSSEESIIGAAPVVGGGSYTNYYNGYMDEVAVWKGTALSDTEILELYQRGIDGYGVFS